MINQNNIDKNNDNPSNNNNKPNNIKNELENKIIMKEKTNKGYVVEMMR